MIDGARTLSTLPAIETERLHLRPCRVGDADAFRAMTDDPVITNAVDFLHTPFTLGDSERLIIGDGDGRDCFWGVWRNDDRLLIGTVGTHLWEFTDIEIGYWFSSGAHGHGYASEAASAVVTSLVAVYPSRRIFAECRPENKASWRLLERIGFRADGRVGLRAGRKRLVYMGP